MYRLCTIFGSCHRIGIHGRIELRPDFFKDIEALLPGVLTKVNVRETGDKRYKSYTDLLRLECANWFIIGGCLPPMQEWTSKRFRYKVDDTRRERIQQLVKDIFQGWKNEGL